VILFKLYLLSQQISIYRLFENHKLSKVREWAHVCIERLNKDIDRERQREEESELGL
jgi:hypothetical protein